jgi:hypothetical protein
MGTLHEGETEDRLELLTTLRDTECLEARTEANCRSLHQEVSDLSRTIGSLVEEIVEALLDDWLQREHRVQVELQRGFHVAALGDEELDGYGEGVGPDGPLVVVAEVKTTVRKREVEAFQKKLERMRCVSFFPVLGVLVGRAIHPAAREEAVRVGLLLVSEKVLRGN